MAITYHKMREEACTLNKSGDVASRVAVGAIKLPWSHEICFDVVYPSGKTIAVAVPIGSFVTMINEVMAEQEDDR